MTQESCGLNAKAVRVWLAEHDLKQKDLVDKAKIGSSYLSSLMRGRAPVTGGVLLKLHDATGLSVDELRLKDWKPTPPPKKPKRRKSGKK